MKLLVGVCVQIREINIASAIISVSTILTIFLVKHFVNDRFKKKLLVPIPVELIVVNAKRHLFVNSDSRNNLNWDDFLDYTVLSFVEVR